MARARRHREGGTEKPWGSMLAGAWLPEMKQAKEERWPVRSDLSY